nr:HDIG domain-containing metalloprotein [Spirulina subsalsa]
MKTLDFFTQRLTRWQRSNPSRSNSAPSKRVKTTPPKSQRNTIPNPMMLVFVVVSLTSVVGYRFYNQPRLKPGMIAPQTIWAEEDVQVVDEELTREQRKVAETGASEVLKLNPEVTAKTRQDLEAFLAQVEQMRRMAGAFPFVSDDVLSLPSQRHLRAISEEDWQTMVSQLQAEFDLPELPRPVEPDPEDSEQNARLQDAVVPSPLGLNAQQALEELENYGTAQGDLALMQLLTKIDTVRLGYSQALKEFTSSQQSIAHSRPETLRERNYKLRLLDLRDSTWESTRDGFQVALDRILAQGIHRGMPEDLKREAIQVQLVSEVPVLTTPLGVELLTEMVKPNLERDEEAIRRLAEQAAEKIEPVVYQIQRGEMIVRSGQEIDRKAFLLLDQLNASERSINWRGLLITSALVTGAVGIFWGVRSRWNVRLRCRDRILLCLLSVSTPLLMQFNQNNVAAVALLVSGFYHPVLAATQVTLITGLSVFGSLSAGSGVGLAWEGFLAGAAGGLLAAFMGGRLRSREELALLGVGVGVTQGVVYLVMTLVGTPTTAALVSLVLPGAMVFGVSGLAWCVVALGVSPYLERVFDLVTPIRLAELSNPNRPLLKRLATEAPGTFQHTLFVASLAEAAARELHCNVELVRAGTLYHDVGKMHDPLGFIENQMGGPNKHDAINDPWQSAEIIKKHVSEGLVMARRCNLPQAVRDFIPEHQGTILISYFYFQASQQAQAEGETIDEQDFRYDGPIPQSRETGIVMLADACEAALRSLKDATPETALNMVNKIFKARWQDNQLVDSGLKREDLTVIAEVFIRVWQQYNHQRIAYPKAILDKQAAPQTVSSNQ